MFLLEEKVDRIDRALGEQKSLIERAALAGRRPGLAADAAVSEHKSAWHAYLRRGDINAPTQFESKALSAGSDPDGGYIAPPELDRMIESRLRQVSPMRAIATVRTTGATVFKKPISLTGAGTGWVAETGTCTQTLAQRIQAEHRAAAETLHIGVGPAELALEPGDRVTFGEGVDIYEIVRIEDAEARQIELRRARHEGAAVLGGVSPSAPPLQTAPRLHFPFSICRHCRATRTMTGRWPPCSRSHGSAHTIFVAAVCNRAAASLQFRRSWVSLCGRSIPAPSIAGTKVTSCSSRSMAVRWSA